MGAVIPVPRPRHPIRLYRQIRLTFTRGSLSDGCMGHGREGIHDMQKLIMSATLSVAGLMFFDGALAQQAQIDRGKYLVTLASCTDCHTPGYFFGKPDMNRFLGGSEVGFEIPGLGVFHGPNLTPDPDTGLGNWSVGQIITALQTGKRPDGRELAPSMPWRAYANLTKDDVTAIAMFLKSLPPVKNKVPGPFGPTEKRQGS
jgi:mono/diheme cytochrome c family protein